MSESEEMYLVTIYTLAEAGTENPIPLSLLAEELNIQSVSANQMVRKLEEAGKVRYAPYKGVALTSSGATEALRILRHRRLWEVFLTDHLKIEPAEAKEIACRMEHIIPEDAAVRLSEFLGNPTHTRQGNPIPSVGQEPPAVFEAPLDRMSAGDHAIITRLDVEEPACAYLQNAGLYPGQELTILAADMHGGSLVQVNGNIINLSKVIASQVWLAHAAVSRACSN